MRRPNRNVEVFDISLMAVVTKAMGAFLVLMLLLMPYYTGPIPAPVAVEMAKQLEEARRKLQQAMQAGDPEELRRLLQEAEARITDAERQLEQLRRDNEHLNAQVKRLEGDLDDANDEIEKLKKKNEELTGTSVGGHLANWDCLDVRLEIGLLNPTTYISLDGGKRNTNVLSETSTLGSSNGATDDDVLERFSDQKSLAPGQGLRFNQSHFRTSAQTGTPYFVVVVARSKTPRKIGKSEIYPLKRPANDCRVIISTDRYYSSTNRFDASYVREFVLSKSDYAAIAWGLEFNSDGTKSVDITPEMQTWFDRQIAVAEKDDPPRPPPKAEVLPPPPDRLTPAERQRIEDERRRMIEERIKKQNQKTP